MFRDYLWKIKKANKTNKMISPKKEQQWLKNKLVSFTFIKDTFMPNPDATIFKI